MGWPVGVFLIGLALVLPLRGRPVLQLLTLLLGCPLIGLVVAYVSFFYFHPHTCS